MKWIGFPSAAVLSLLASAVSLDAQERGRAEFPNLHKRREATPRAVAVTAGQLAAADNLKQRIPGVRIDWDEVLGSPRFILNEQGFLSGPDSEDELLTPGLLAAAVAKVGERNDPNRRIKQFLVENTALFGHGSEILTAARVAREFVTAHNGMRTVVWDNSSTESRCSKRCSTGTSPETVNW